MRVVLQFRTKRNSTVAINDQWLLLKPELLWLLIVNALQLNELNALRNTFYPEYKYVCMYVCKMIFGHVRWKSFLSSSGIYFIWPESLGIIYFLLIISWWKTLTLTLTLFFLFFSNHPTPIPPLPPLWVTELPSRLLDSFVLNVFHACTNQYRTTRVLITIKCLKYGLQYVEYTLPNS